MATKTASPINLFAAATVKPAAKKTPEKKSIQANDLEDKIQQFLKLKAEIEETTGQMKMLEGDIKTTGKELYMNQYIQERHSPENFNIVDATGSKCLFIMMDKYVIVEPEKAELLGDPEFDGLLDEKIVYTFNADLVEKYGQALSDMIIKSPHIAPEDKANLISGEKTYSIKKGSIDRLLQYPDPQKVFEIINPICALKK